MNDTLLGCGEARSVELCCMAIQQNTNSLAYVREQDLEVCMAAAQRSNSAVKHIRDNETHSLVVRSLACQN